MNQKLKILLVEDNALDAELAISVLCEANVACDAIRVETEEEFRRHLQTGGYDLILSDYSLPKFSGIIALQIAKQVRPEIPFIFVSGVLGEDNAVDMLKEGATDYVLKQRLKRLEPAVKRAVSEATERIDRKKAEELVVVERKRVQQQQALLLASERAARGEAERASRMKDEFLATLSHELRTPLNAILGWSQILAMGDCGPEDLAEGLKIIERNARAQTQIIDDLLDMSRIISGKVQLDVRPVDLLPIISTAVETLRPAAMAKSIRVLTDFKASQVSINADPGRLSQVLWNLLSNAIKFTPRDGSVRVVVDETDSNISLSVMDTGEGIPAEFVPFVFDRFRQADATTSRRHGGLGLGLSIVKQLVELHGGAVQCQSDGPGKGATFTVTLPNDLIDDQHLPHAVVVGTTPGDMHAIKGVKVLVVDDEPDSRAVVKRVLEDCHALVSTASSAEEAMQRVITEKPAVLISDIGMPGEDGHSFIQRVRALGPDHGGSVPAVALTAYAGADDRARALRAGFQLHAAKPIEPSQLIAVVAKLAREMDKGTHPDAPYTHPGRL
jgi:signal transduction histidine kinase